METKPKSKRGGFRPGSGRPRKVPAPLGEVKEAPEPAGNTVQGKKHEPVRSGFLDPLKFLEAVWMGEIDATPAQVRSATAALPFIHMKLGEGGKKEGKERAAQNTAAGKFAAAAPPLKLVGNK